MLNFNDPSFSLFYLRLGWKGDILLNCQILHSSILPHSLTLFLHLFLFLSLSFSSTHSSLHYNNTNTETTMLLLPFTINIKNKKMRGPTTEDDVKPPVFFCFCPKTTAESASLIVVRFTNTVKHTVSVCTRTAFVMDVTRHVCPNLAAAAFRLRHGRQGLLYKHCHARLLLHIPLHLYRRKIQIT